MNADNPEVLRSGGSSGVAGISTFMSRTRRKSEASRGSAPPGNSSLRRHRCRRYNRVLRRSVQTVPDRNHRVVEFTVENYGQNGAVDAFATPPESAGAGRAMGTISDR